MFTSNSIKNLVVLGKKGRNPKVEKNNFFFACRLMAKYVQGIYSSKVWEDLSIRFMASFTFSRREVYKWDFKSLIPRAWTKRKEKKKKKRWNCRVHSRFEKSQWAKNEINSAINPYIYRSSCSITSTLKKKFFFFAYCETSTARVVCITPSSAK